MILPVFVIGYIYSKFNLPLLPFGLSISFVTVMFFYLGFLSNDWMIKMQASIIKCPPSCVKISIVVTVFLTILWGVYFDFGSVNIMTASYGRIDKFLFFSFLYISLFYFIADMIKKNDVLEYLGKNTLPIFCLHGIVLRILIFMSEKLLHIPGGDIKSNFLFVLIICAICLVLLIPFVAFYNNTVQKLLYKYVISKF